MNNKDVQLLAEQYSKVNEQAFDHPVAGPHGVVTQPNIPKQAKNLGSHIDRAISDLEKSIADIAEWSDGKNLPPIILPEIESASIADFIKIRHWLEDISNEQ